jgi:hypothetical protein
MVIKLASTTNEAVREQSVSHCALGYLVARLATHPIVNSVARHVGRSVITPSVNPVGGVR